MNYVLEAMKRMEWQIAKGHLVAMLETYHSPPGTGPGMQRDTTAFDAMRRRVDRFIKEVEGDL